MKTIRLIFAILLCCTVLLRTLPVFFAEDVAMDGYAGLKNAILATGKLAENVEKSETFASDIKRTLSAFQVAVGLKTVIKKADKKGYSFQNSFYLIFIYVFCILFVYYSPVYLKKECYVSCMTLPKPRPPRR